MKKAAKILFIVGTVYSWLAVLGFVISGVVYLIGGLNVDILRQVLEENSGSADISVEALQIIALVCAVLFFLCAVIAVVGAIISHKCLKNVEEENFNKGLNIAGIVFGALISTPTLVGAILAMIANKK